MTDFPVLRSLGYILVAAALFVVVARFARIPSIVAYILAGLALGPLTGLVRVTETIHLTAEVGIALLLFVVGLELSLDKIRDVGRVALVAGIGQVVFTAAGGYALAWVLGFSPMESLFISTALTFSSTVVVVKLLDQKKELDTLYGRIAVGIFLVQDLVVIVVLTFLAGLGRTEAVTTAQAVGGLATAFVGMGALLAAALLAARFVLPRVFGSVADHSETLFIWSLCWLFLFVLAAEGLGLSLEVGAFLAGISLAQLPYNGELRRRVHPLMNFLIAIFFVSLGIQMELGAAAAHVGAVVAFSIFVLLGNPFIFMWIITSLRYGERTAFLTSVTVAQISEFSFIFAAVGLANGLIDETIVSLITVVGLVTIGVSSYMILYNHELYGWSRRFGLLGLFRSRPEPESPPPSRPEGHVIVVGMNALGVEIVRELVRQGHQVLAVDTDPRKLADLPCPTLLGDVEHPTLLEEANLHGARAVVSALRIEDTNKLLGYRCRELGVPAAIHAFDRSVVDELRELGVDYLIMSKNVGVQRLAVQLQHEGVLQS